MGGTKGVVPGKTTHLDDSKSLSSKVHRKVVPAKKARRTDAHSAVSQYHVVKKTAATSGAVGGPPWGLPTIR